MFEIQRLRLETINGYLVKKVQSTLQTIGACSFEQYRWLLNSNWQSIIDMTAASCLCTTGIYGIQRDKVNIVTAESCSLIAQVAMKYRKIPELRRNIYYDNSEFVNFWKLQVTSAEAKYFICRWMVCKSCSIVLNLVVNYHLVVYPQQCHIGIIVSHLCVNIIALHVTLLFAFSRAKR